MTTSCSQVHFELVSSDLLLPPAIRSGVRRLDLGPGTHAVIAGVASSCPSSRCVVGTGGKGVPFVASAPVLAREIVEQLGGLTLSGRRLRMRNSGGGGSVSKRRRCTPHLCVAYRRRASSMRQRDLGGHYRANRDAFAAFDSPLQKDAPTGVLAATDAAYRSSVVHQPRGLLSAAFALVAGDDDEVEAFSQSLIQ